jgi:hypothetical protein
MPLSRFHAGKAAQGRKSSAISTPRTSAKKKTCLSVATQRFVSMLDTGVTLTPGTWEVDCERRLKSAAGVARVTGLGTASCGTFNNLKDVRRYGKLE